MSVDKAQVVATYTAAADHYDDACAAFWGYFGRRTVERLALSRGARVLDVCCGTGASALPAAEAVGPTGSVLGLDLTPALLAQAESKARRRGFDHLELLCADFESVTPSQAPFDAVLCVFGIFFLPDMAAALRRLWEWVRPGGAIAITTWGRTVLEPVSRVFWEGVRRERPDLHRAFQPWERIATPNDLVGLFEAAGIPGSHAEVESRAFAVAPVEAFWDVVLGSGFRGTLERMAGASQERLRRRLLEALRSDHVSALEMEVVYGIAHKGDRGAV
jgi:ubiquinone/menaquinone biosynthesis C-methylase UbiE